jgi:hypothetical protein
MLIFLACPLPPPVAARLHVLFFALWFKETPVDKPSGSSRKHEGNYNY